MIMKMKNILFAIVLTLGILVGCGTADNNPNVADTEQTEVQVEIIISLENQEEILEEEVLTVDAGTSLMEVMEENFDIINNGGFISSINGIQAEDGQPYAWMYTVNGEDATKGAEDYIIKDGDVIEFDFHSWE